MTFSWSLFAWGREHCCPHSSLGGVVGDTQERTQKSFPHTLPSLPLHMTPPSSEQKSFLGWTCAQLGPKPQGASSMVTRLPDCNLGLLVLCGGPLHTSASSNM